MAGRYGGGIYNDKPLVEQEAKRLREMSSYPDQVIVDVLGESIDKGTRFLDVGGGSSIGLWNFIESKGGEYHSCDLNERMLQAKKEAYLSTHHGSTEGISFDERLRVEDAKNLSYPNESFNIVNMRFVLAHVPSQDWNRVIRECVRVSRNRVIFAEFDWTPLIEFGELNTSDSTIKTFCEISERFARLSNIDRYAGLQLCEGVSDVLGGLPYEISDKIFSREIGDYREELVPIMSVMLSRFKQLDDIDIAKTIENLLDDIQEREVLFVPPDVVVVEVFKNN